MRLYFIRHGKASNMADTDHARPLTEVGVERTQLIARVLLRLEVAPVRIVASPRVRAQQTAEIIAQTLVLSFETSDLVNYEFDLSAVSELISGLKPDSEVVFVGHNPSMSEVVQEMTGATLSLKTSAVACVDVTPPGLTLARLHWLLTPRLAGAFTDE